MTDSEIERLTALADAANDRWDDEKLHKPTSTSWGFFAYGDASPAIGGGMGGFSWFSSKSAMLEFISSVLPFSPPGQSNRDPLAVAVEVEAVTKQLKSNGIDQEVARKKLNRILKSFSQIEWVGTFQDLKGGQSPYARKLIMDFRRQNDIKISTKPVEVSRSELADFKEFLDQYGV